MQKKIRTGYGYLKGKRSYGPGEIVDVTEEEFQKKRWIFEPDRPQPEQVKEEAAPAPVEIEARASEEKEEEKVEEKVEEKGPEELPVPQNRAVLDTTSGNALLKKGTSRSRSRR